MTTTWTATTLSVTADALRTFTQLRGNRWLCRGHAKCYGTLTPSIDRGKLRCLARTDKLACERQSIDLFRSTARLFADGERAAYAAETLAGMRTRAQQQAASRG